MCLSNTSNTCISLLAVSWIKLGLPPKLLRTTAHHISAECDRLISMCWDRVYHPHKIRFGNADACFQHMRIHSVHINSASHWPLSVRIVFNMLGADISIYFDAKYENAIAYDDSRQRRDQSDHGSYNRISRLTWCPELININIIHARTCSPMSKERFGSDRKARARLNGRIGIQHDFMRFIGGHTKMPTYLVALWCRILNAIMCVWL